MMEVEFLILDLDFVRKTCNTEIMHSYEICQVAEVVKDVSEKKEKYRHRGKLFKLPLLLYGFACSISIL